MKTKKQLEQDIINITLKIHTEFPELTKYISEIPEQDYDPSTGQMSAWKFKEYYNSLAEIVKEYSKSHKEKNDSDSKMEGYPHYPPSEDIYSKGKKERNLDPENPSKNKSPKAKNGTFNEKEFSDDMSGNDLDVPGSELDDQQEKIGSEDEENNYYSLGGDNHDDLKEDKI
ncbi:hypothetical protein [Algoriphagus sp.]|uniref:hypothetical protein n=1 Tax=Algoriphagus sp. TaxID=1872435 RepID=UPI0025F90E25|nr:hypothetical protein [Algoriphagus sp.]